MAAFNPFMAGVAFEYSELPKIVAVHKVMSFPAGPEINLGNDPVPVRDVGEFYSLFSPVSKHNPVNHDFKTGIHSVGKRLSSKVLKNDATVIVIDDDDDDNDADDSIQIKSEPTAEPVIEPVLLNPEVTLEIDPTELPLPDVMEVLQDVDGNINEVEFYDQSANPLFTRQKSIVQPMEQQVQLKVRKDSTEVRANTNRSTAAKNALFTRQNSIVQQPMQPVEEKHKGVIKVIPRKSVEVTSSRASHVHPLQLKVRKDSEEVRANTNRSPVKQQVSRHVQFERCCQLVAKLKKKKKAAPKGKTCKTPMRHELIKLGPKKPNKRLESHCGVPSKPCRSSSTCSSPSFSPPQSPNDESPDDFGRSFFSALDAFFK